MKHVFNTSVGTLQASLDPASRRISISRLDGQQRTIAAAIEDWDHVDLLDVLNRQLGLPLTEANRVATELREQTSLGSLAERVAWGKQERAKWRGLEKAGIPLRFVAVLLDLVLVLFPLAIVVGLMTGGGSTESGSGNANVAVDVTGGAAWLLLALVVGYYVVCEAATGMTLGKRIVGIRVVAEDGRHITVGAAVVRNLLRLIDALVFYLVGFLFAVSSRRGQRLGDRAAHTIVIRS
jgi:uncharacterized RDD family membrane protein YckC